MLRSLLNLKNCVTVTRLTETSDGMGGLTTTSSVTTLSRCNIWTVSSGDRTLSDKITRSSTHVLALEHCEYTFTPADRTVGYNSNTYTITGNMDNVGERGELDLMGLVWLE